MKQRIKQAVRHPLIYGSAVVFSGNLLTNFINFLFNLFMKRNLSEADYGILATVISLILLPMLLASAIVPLVVRYGGDYFANRQYHMARGLYIKIAQLYLLIDIGIFILVLVFISQLNKFFHFDNNAILFVTDGIIFFGLMGVINQAFIQAKLAFLSQTVISAIGSAVKLFLGMLFFYRGLAALSGPLAILFASIAGYVSSFVPLRFIFDRKMATPKFNSKELLRYGIPSSLVLFGLTSFISADIILVKHFFIPSMAGIYAGLSLIGRVVFYFSAPIGGVMFPVLVQKVSRKENVANTFFLSLLLVLLPSIAITVFYFLFPRFTVLFFTGKKEDLVIVPYLGYFGIFTSLYSLLTIICNFYLSIKKTFVFIPIILGALLQIVFIIFYHQNFMQIIAISTIITFLLVLSLLVYYPYATKK